MNPKPIFEVNNNIDQTTHYWFTEVFSEEELMWIENLQKEYQYERASIVGSTSFNDTEQIRKSKIKWISLDEKSEWLYEKLSNLCIEANDNLWGFNLNNIKDEIQYTEYGEGGNYDWHVDIGPYPINHRKISIVVFLTDDHVGGELELWSGGNFQNILKKRGNAIIFPSYLLHRVTPVTEGIRKSLVLWVGGDSYQ